MSLNLRETLVEIRNPVLHPITVDVQDSGPQFGGTIPQRVPLRAIFFGRKVTLSGLP